MQTALDLFQTLSEPDWCDFWTISDRGVFSESDFSHGWPQCGNCPRGVLTPQQRFVPEPGFWCNNAIVDGRVAGHLGAADSLKTSSIHVCICPHFGM